MQQWVMNSVWTAEAEDDFKAIILYLKENWSIQSANRFSFKNKA